jgi:hypothetical protein
MGACVVAVHSKFVVAQKVRKIPQKNDSLLE